MLTASSPPDAACLHLYFTRKKATTPKKHLLVAFFDIIEFYSGTLKLMFLTFCDQIYGNRLDIINYEFMVNNHKISII